MQKLWIKLFALLLVLNLSGCGYNTFQTKDEEIKANWAEVLNQYQRRADLVPNLVATVKGYAAHERKCWKPWQWLVPGWAVFRRRRS